MTESELPRTLALVTRPLVIGLGTNHRGDDQCGLDVARVLREPLKGRAQVAECSADVTELLDLWADVDEAIVVDAVRSGRAPGTVVRFEIPGGDPPLLGPTSTHGLSLSEAIGLGRALGRFPRRLIVYGIEAGDVTMGSSVSAAGARGIREASARVLAEVTRYTSPLGSG